VILHINLFLSLVFDGVPFLWPHILLLGSPDRTFFFSAEASRIPPSRSFQGGENRFSVSREISEPSFAGDTSATIGRKRSREKFLSRDF